MANYEASDKRAQFANIPTVSMIRREVARPGMEKDWKQIQNNTFRNWSNYIIAEQGREEVKVKDLLLDFSTGVNLIELVNHLANPRGIKNYVKNPKTEFQKLDNLNKALNFIQKEEGIKLVGIGAEDMKDGREKQIMGLIWTLIKHYKIRRGGKEGEKGGSASDSLKKWVNYFIAPKKINNFEKDWNDGIAVCSLVEGLCPDTIDTSELNGEEDIENCELGIAKAFEVLNVPKLISGEDMSNPGVDQLSMMTYLSGFISAFEKLLIDWVKRKIPEKETQNLSTDWNSGDRLTALMNAFIPEFWEQFNEGNQDSLQKLLNKIEEQFPTKYNIKAEEMMDSGVDNLVIGCYLFRLKQKLDELEKFQLREKERIERERLAEEKLRRERQKVEQEREKERLTQEKERVRLDNEWLALERETERLEREKLERERLERERLERERLERERLERERLERERLERERLERERLEREKLEQEKAKVTLAQEMEKQRIESEKLSKEAIERAYYREEQYQKQKSDLLNWVNEMLWPRKIISNFEEDWKSADTIKILLNNIVPNILPESESEVREDNFEWTKALTVAENKFGLKADFTGIEFSRGLKEKENIKYVSTFVEPFIEEILAWVNSKLSAKLHASNFGVNWQDGKRLEALIEAISPGFIPIGFDSVDTQQGEELLDKVHRVLHITCPYRYEDIISGNFEPAIMAAYLNRFRHITPPISQETEDIVESPYPAIKDPEIALPPAQFTVTPILKTKTRDTPKQSPPQVTSKRPKAVRYFVISSLSLVSILIVMLLVAVFIWLAFLA